MSNTSRPRLVRALCLALLAAATVSARPAEVKLNGFGLLRDRELKQSLALLLDNGKIPEQLDAGYIEDACLVLNADLIEAGFFKSAVRATWIDSNGRSGEALLDADFSQPLPRPLWVTSLRLEAVPGIRAVVADVEIEGLTAVPINDAKVFFRPSSGWFTPDKARAWSSARMLRASGQLRDTLRAGGYAEARIELEETPPDEKTGAVRLVVRVAQGPKWRITGWRAEIAGGGDLPGGEPPGLKDAAWSHSKAVDLAHVVRRRYHEMGYADARVNWVAEPADVAPGTTPAEREVVAVAKITPGQKVVVGRIDFLGADKTRTGLLNSRVRLEQGALYNPEHIDDARLRLARLGVFRRIEATGQDTVTPGVRDVLFQVTEEASWAAFWLIGYGSYEQLRVKGELSRSNLWGSAHRDQLEVTQSLKSTQGEYRYTVPTLFNDTVEGSARLFGLRRDEPAFLRVEYGAGLDLARAIPWLDARGTSGLAYEVLRAENASIGAVSAETAVMALNLGLSRDERDNPIRPHNGYRWSLQTEFALPELGSEVRYERLELALSWHRPLGTERWLHCGVSQGIVGGGGNGIPVNKLFFPGGESSIRGYPEGEAARFDATGHLVGVRSSLLLNLELEQQITGRWTGVVFSDTVGTALSSDKWPGDEVLGSIGLGLRYQSPIGPVRLEYGHNLNPRPGDPAGTLHFSIGFPF
jgi:outer membrane protein insertion porin family